MKENICFYEEDESLKNCGFFEFLCKIGFEFNNKFFDEDAFFKAKKAIIYKELLAWPKNSKKRINNLLIASILARLIQKSLMKRKIE